MRVCLVYFFFSIFLSIPILQPIVNSIFPPYLFIYFSSSILGFPPVTSVGSLLGIRVNRKGKTISLVDLPHLLMPHFYKL